MITRPPLIIAIAAGLMLCATIRAGAPPAPAVAWRGLPDSPDYFPIAVWTQSPANAMRYRDIGINLYVGLWKGPAEAQLAALEKAGMPVICSYSEQFKDRKIIVGWMHGDEPDNAQPLPEGKGWGPPITPEKVLAHYRWIREQDPSRPVLLNLGQGVAWDNWHGRGVRTRHPEDYPEYAKAADILSFDIYPVTHRSPEVRGRLWYVGQGVRRLRQWSDVDKPVWSCIESTHIQNPELKPTPQQTRSMVWMSLVHGARGLIYFSHQFKPRFIEAGILADPEMSAEIRRINAQIMELAPVLNSQTLPDLAAASSSEGVPIHLLNKKHRGEIYIFAINGRDLPTRGTIAVPELKADATVTVLGEDRTITATGGKFSDDFASYEVHLYRITPGPAAGPTGNPAAPLPAGSRP
jgi:hypothetical protein